MTSRTVQVRARWVDGRVETLNPMDLGVESQELQGLGEDGRWYSFRHSGEMDDEGFLIFDQRPEPVSPETSPADVAVLSAECFTCRKRIEVHAKTTNGFAMMKFYAVDCPHCSETNDLPLPGDIVSILKADDSN